MKKCKHYIINPRSGSLHTTLIDDGNDYLVCSRCGVKMKKDEFKEKLTRIANLIKQVRFSKLEENNPEKRSNL